MNELLIYGGASFAFAAGYAFRAYFSRPSDEGYWEAIAERKEKLATDNWNRFVDACKECNAIEGDYQEALASNRRLTDALQCKNERLERIKNHFEGQSSGSAKIAVKMAKGDM